MEYLVELFCGKEAELNASLLKRNVILERLLCSLCRVFITDIGVERGDEHKRVVKVVMHLFAVCGDSDSALSVEGDDGLCQKSCGLKEVVNANGHKYVKLEVTL